MTQMNVDRKKTEDGLGWLTLPAAVLFRPQILDRHDVPRVKRHDKATIVHDHNRSRGNKNKLRMGYGIFVPVRGEKAERAETTGEPAPNLLEVHEDTVVWPQCLVNGRKKSRWFLNG